MAERPKTLEEVNWELATDAFVRAARNMTLAEIHEEAERGADQLEAKGEAASAEAMRRVAAVLKRRLTH